VAIRSLFVLLWLCAAVCAQDPETNCPRYPQAQRTELLQALDLERQFAEYQARARKDRAIGGAAFRNAIARANFIDNHVLDKMDADKVAAAPLTNDAEFIRRASIDITGRIPQPERVKAFLADFSPTKRAKLIDDLLASPAYTDQWTLFFANKFQVTSGYYIYVGLEGRNAFHRFLRDFVARDRSYSDVVTEMITASGDPDENGPANFLVRGWQDGDPIQDTWDTITDRITTRLLGLKTECISCHDGRGHLEQINLHLSRRRRIEFWGMSAFFSRMSVQRLNNDAFGQRARFFITDRKTGAYSTSVDINNPGPRPPRYGGPYTPAWAWGGQKPESAAWREELARILTEDRQFAKATVNYIWAQLFNYGIVDPPDGWDLARVDPSSPPPGSWPMQVSHPELLEALADYFIQNGYRIKPLVRLILNSNTYQLSSRYDGEWKAAYTRYFARHTPRRLAAEELWDSLATATQTETPMFVYGFDQPLQYANQLPDPTEPRSDFQVTNFLSLFGRGDWWNIGRDPRPSLLQLLYTMNDSQVVLRTFASRGDAPVNRVARIASSTLSDADAVRELYLATLSRPATQEEVDTVLRMKKGTRADWLADLQWVLVNKLDFIFSY